MQLTERNVKIDYLAFTMPFCSLKSLETYPHGLNEWRKYGIYPTFHNHVSHKDAFFTDVIKGGKWCPSDDELNEQVQSYSTYSKDELERKINDLNREIYLARMHRLKLWLSAVFGLHLGPESDRGGYNYDCSAPLYSVDGGYEHLGMVFWGGNNDTIYIQISGEGCTHVFNGTSPHEIYNWLHHLDVTMLKRIDLAVDDFDGVFTVSAAMRDHKCEAFYGGKGPKPGLGISHKYHGNGSLQQEMITVGSRESRVYWRIYNKALEQKVDDIWHRSEAELKGFPLEILLDIEGAFTGLCEYAQQINPASPKTFQRSGVVRLAINSFESDVRWLRKQASKTIARIFHQLGNDYEAVFSSIVRKEHMDDLTLKFRTPDIYQNIVAQKFYNRECAF